MWGTSAKHYPQRCGESHVLHDEDVVQIVKKKIVGGGAEARGTDGVGWRWRREGENGCFAGERTEGAQPDDSVCAPSPRAPSRPPASQARGRFKTTSSEPLRISDREKKKPLRS